MRLRLGTVIAFDDEEIGLGALFPELFNLAVLGRAVAGERGFVVLELDGHEARTDFALHRLAAAGAHDVAAAELAQHVLDARDIGLVGVGVGHIDQRQPVSLSHDLAFRSLAVQCAAAISATMASAAALGSPASTMGLPTTR